MTDDPNFSNLGQDIDYELIMKKTGKTIEDLKFECQIAHSQFTTYFNAILLVAGLTIAITPFMISNIGTVNIAYTTETICLLSTSLGCIIGGAYCIYGILRKSKNVEYIMKKYSLVSLCEISDEKRRFNYFRMLYISHMQIGYKVRRISIIFALCISLFAFGFTLLVLNSLFPVNPILTFIIIYATLFIIIYLQIKTLIKNYSLINENVEILIYIIKNVFFEEKFENLKDLLKFAMLIASGRQPSD